MKQIDKEKWVEDTLESLAGSKRAQAPDTLLERAMSRAAFGRARVVRMPAAQLWSAVACTLILVIANLSLCLDFSHQSKSAKEGFAKEYFGNSDAIPF